MAAILWVSLGGVVGALARYGVNEFALRMVKGPYPLATLAVNVIGCLVIGALMPAMESKTLSPSLRLFLVTGLLGAFTTFSAFGFETLTLLREGRSGLALANVAANLALGLTAVAAGRWIALAARS